MIRKSITVEDALVVLNRAFKADPLAIDALRSAKVPCNKELAYDQEIQVGTAGAYFDHVYEDRPYAIGFLGIVNGMFGKDEETGYGAIAMMYDVVCPNGHEVLDDLLLSVGNRCPDCGATLILGNLLGFEAVDHEAVKKAAKERAENEV